MSVLPSPLKSQIVRTGPSSATHCQILVDCRYAESFIQFLLARKVKLTPPEGGVITRVKRQLTKTKAINVHGFYAELPPEKVIWLAGKWEKATRGYSPRLK